MWYDRAIMKGKEGFWMRIRILLLALLLACLTACGGKGQSAPPEAEPVAETQTEGEGVTEAAPEAETTVTGPAEAVTPVEETEEKSGGWVFPNGIPETGETPTEAATEQAVTEQAPTEAATVAERPDEIDDPLNYTVSKNADGNIEYLFDVLLVTVPGDWEGKYTIVRSNDTHVNFYHTGSYEAWQENYGFAGGFLFGISLEQRGVDPDYPSEQYLGLARNGLDYYMIFPTDVQGYVEDQAVYDEWCAMVAEMDVVTENSWSMLFHD